MQIVPFELIPRQWINVVGANGSGKSTLVRKLAADKLVPYVLQDPRAQLFGETLREELAFSERWLGEPVAEASSIVEALGLSDLLDCSWDQLSGGQCQAAVIATALCTSSRLYIFDEATAMLDEPTSDVVRNMVRHKQAQGATIVWVTQRLQELERGQRVIGLRPDGKIDYDGEVESFLYEHCEHLGVRTPYFIERMKELVGPHENMRPLHLREWLASKQVNG